MTDQQWFYERSFRGSLAFGAKIKKVLHEEQSQFQNIKVIDTEPVGKLLLLDDKTMVADIDEFVYHEVTAHIPYMVHPKVRNVLVIGGGDGGVVREFTKHSDIETIDLVEIDERVIEVSRQFFPECTQGLDDPRVNIQPTDGIEFIKSKKNQYDIIVVDSTDPEDFAEGLFTKDFYSAVNSALKDDGIMINQTENPFYDEFGIRKIYDNMREAFPIVRSYHAPMLIYPGVYWTFGFSSKKYQPLEIIADKIPAMKKLEKTLKWYNLDWHRGAFALGNLHKNLIGE